MGKFELSKDAVTAKDYVGELRCAALTLTPEEIIEGIDSVAAKRIEEIRNTKTEVTVKGKKYYVATTATTPQTVFRRLRLGVLSQEQVPTSSHPATAYSSEEATSSEVSLLSESA